MEKVSDFPENQEESSSQAVSETEAPVRPSFFQQGLRFTAEKTMEVLALLLVRKGCRSSRVR